jgi:hypothetical protein
MMRKPSRTNRPPSSPVPHRPTTAPQRAQRVHPVLPSLWVEYELLDATGQTHQVRITGICEEVPKPSDSGRWGESVIALILVEV